MKSKQEIINAKLDTLFALVYQQVLSRTEDALDVQDAENHYIRYRELKKEWNTFATEYGD